ncbi:O-methyltransferase [Robiginitalea sp. SC105]|uniref:O-methyltransferase n=1 Tax=Robiginitalea sp. SC105 TaxID=2762332 RepID=UPI00163A3CC6|nr:O-methyltransferase [Robiginitalea sp. SC105]MBC2839058.1 O-methyltransferase [Robiginitalea sp. SC105]
MHFLSHELEQYIEASSEPEPELLAELTRETHLKVLRPRMLTGHHQGRVLSLISQLLRPGRILEIGTYTGYSALCLAEGLSKDGELHTIDKNEELLSIQRKYFDRSPYGKKIIQHTGLALDLLPQMRETFDLVFIDAEKQEYAQYLEAVLPLTRSGTLILLDNVLWSGKVLDPEASDPVTESLKKLNADLPKDPRFQVVLLPIRDGLTACRVR